MIAERFETVWPLIKIDDWHGESQRRQVLSGARDLHQVEDPVLPFEVFRAGTAMPTVCKLINL